MVFHLALKQEPISTIRLKKKKLNFVFALLHTASLTVAFSLKVICTHQTLTLT